MTRLRCERVHKADLGCARRFAKEISSHLHRDSSVRLDARPTDELRFRPREAKGVVALAYAPEVSEGFEALAAVIGARMRVLAEKSV